MSYLTDSALPVCKALKSNGAPCKSVAMSGLDVCYMHSDRAKLAQRAGGRLRVARMNIEPPDLSTPELQRQFLEKLIAQTQNGEIGLSVAKFSAYVVSIVQGLTDQELAKRLEALELAYVTK